MVKLGSVSYRCPLGLPWSKGEFPSSCREADFNTADLLQALSVPQLIALAHQSSATAAEGWVKVLLCFAGQEPLAGTAKIRWCFSEFEDAFANRPDLLFHLRSSALTRTWLLWAQRVWMCVGALLRGHEQDTCLAAVGFMPPRPNRWRLWVLVDSTVCVRDLCSRRLVVKRAPAALSVGGGGGPDCIGWGASGSWGADSNPDNLKFIPSKTGKSQHSTSRIVLIFCFSLHLTVTVSIMIAVFDQLSSLIMSKGMISSRTFVKFGWEQLGLILETPESCSCCGQLCSLPLLRDPGVSSQTESRTREDPGRFTSFPLVAGCLSGSWEADKTQTCSAGVHDVVVAGAGRGRSRAESEPGQREMKLVVV